jgi:hypothetical protein
MSDVFNAGDFMISGHLHPQTPSIMHSDQESYVINPALVNSDNGGLVTMERGAIVYHELRTLERNGLFVSYPIPLDQLNPRQVFNENSFPIRVLAFCEDEVEPTLQYSIDSGAFVGLPFVSRLNSTVFFHSIQITNIGNGKHSLVVKSGATSTELEFFVGQKSPKVRHGGLSFMTPKLFFAVVPVLIVLCLLKLLPWWLFLSEKIDEFETYMKDGEGDVKWYHQLWLGPLYLWSRFRNVPLIMSIWLGALLVWYLPLPYYLTMIEDVVQGVWCWGVIANGELFKFNTPLWFTAVFLLMMELPLLCITGNIYERGRLCLAQKIEIGLFVVPLVIVLVMLFVVLIVTGGAFSFFTSPALYVLLSTYGFFGYRWIRDYREKIRVSTAVGPQTSDDAKEPEVHDLSEPEPNL